MLSRAKALYHAGMSDEAVVVLSQMQRQAKEAQLSELRAMALDLLQRISDESFEGVQKGSAKVERQFELQMCRLQIRELAVSLELAESATPSDDQQQLLARAFALGREEDSVILIWWHLASLKLGLKAEAIRKAYHHWLWLNHLSSKQNGLPDDLLCDIYLEGAKALIGASQLDSAALFIRKAEALHKHVPQWTLKLLETRFVWHFLKRDYKACDDLLSEALAQPEIKAPGQQLKWYFLEACLHFVESDFSIASVLLTKSREVGSQPGPYRLAYWVVTLLNKLESKKSVEADETIHKLTDVLLSLQGSARRIDLAFRLLTELKALNYELEQLSEAGRNSAMELAGLDTTAVMIDLKGWVSQQLNSPSQ